MEAAWLPHFRLIFPSGRRGCKYSCCGTPPHWLWKRCDFSRRFEVKLKGVPIYHIMLVLFRNKLSLSKYFWIPISLHGILSCLGLFVLNWLLKSNLVPCCSCDLLERPDLDQPAHITAEGITLSFTPFQILSLLLIKWRRLQTSGCSCSGILSIIKG